MSVRQGKLDRVFSAVAACVFLFMSQAQAEGLLKDGQIIFLAAEDGNTYTHIYDAEAKTFGPLKRPARASKFQVLKNNGNQLVYRGPRDTCSLTPDRRFACPKLGNGTWSVQ